MPSDGIKFQRIRLLSAPVEWSALKTRLSIPDTHWPKSSVAQLHQIEKSNVGEMIWRFIAKQPGVAEPTDDSTVLPSPTDENKNNLETPLQTTNVVASNATIANDVGASKEGSNDTVEPNAFDDLKAHEAELHELKRTGMVMTEGCAVCAVSEWQARGYDHSGCPFRWYDPRRFWSGIRCWPVEWPLQQPGTRSPACSGVQSPACSGVQCLSHDV